MGIEIASVNESGVSMTASGNTIKISGTIEAKQPYDFMNSFFNNAHNEIVKNKLEEVEVDITELSYLNSSGIREFVVWILKIHEESTFKYSIKFISNSEIEWQEVTVNVLILLKPNYISIKKITKNK